MVDYLGVAGSRRKRLRTRETGLEPIWQTRRQMVFSVLNSTGSLVGPDPELPTELLQEMYRLMVLSREFDRRLFALQRQGRMGTYAMLEGQEATQIGSALALEPDDFVFPSYREQGVQLARGMPAEVVMSYWRGLPNDGWDVQAYRHNIVTVPIATQLPHAVGYSYVTGKEGIVTLVYFGDGATSEGDFHSGMNFAGVWKTPTVFLCSNNLYAISVPVSLQTASETISQKAAAYGFEGVQVDGMDVIAVYLATKQAVEKARTGGGPTLIEALTYRYGGHATADDPTLYRTKAEERKWRGRDPIDRLRKFLQARDQWDEQAEEKVSMEVTDLVETAITEIEARPLPTRDDAVRHGYARIPLEVVDQLHDMQEAMGEPLTEFTTDDVWQVGHDAPPAGETELWNIAEALNATLAQAMENDPNVILLGEDVGVAGGVFRITEGLQKRFGTERVIDTPLDEAGIVGTAIGMAMAGARPVAEIQFDGFVYPAFDQIVGHLGRMRYRTRGHVPVPVVVRFPNGPGIGAHEFHCDSPEALFAHSPGLVVVSPSNPLDAKGLLAAALVSDDPVIFMEPKVLYRTGREAVPVGHFTVPLGRARIHQTGDDLTLVTYGAMVPVALTATKASGASIEVIDLRTISPWDRETVLASVEKTGRLVVVQEPPGTCGVAADVSAVVAEKLLYSLQSPVVRVTGYDAPWPQFAIEKHALIRPQRIEAAIRLALG